MKTVSPILFLLATLGTPTEEWQRVEPGLELAFPRDHGVHREVRTEWWYLTGNVTDPDGRRFGFQFTIFRKGLDPRPLAPGASALRARHAYAGHLAIADLDGGRFLVAERLRREAAGLAGGSDEELSVFVEDWSLQRGADGRLRIEAADPATGIALALELASKKPLVRNGAGGYSQKGAEPGNASAYVSWTRLAVAGELAVDGVPRRVTGAGWFDHEWGTSQLGAGVVGWDWFSLQLGDGRELMLYALRREDGRPSPFSAGTLVAADGSARHLTRDEFRIEPTATWRSPRSGGEYPAGWKLSVPGHGLSVTVRPLLADCELATGGSTGITYWEGPVRVEGDAEGRSSVEGRGYVELVGYAGSLAGRF